jgi:hypothetical protein
VTQGRLLTGIVLAVLAGVGVWIARNTYWDQIDEFTPPRGAAADNPYYSLERFAQGLGVTTRQVPTVETLPPANAVLIYGFAAAGAASAERLRALEHWVEAGGRLLVPSSALYSSKSLRSWAGVVLAPRPPAPRPVFPIPGAARVARPPDCAVYPVEVDGLDSGKTLSECEVGGALDYKGPRTPLWSLRASNGFHALRVQIGRGTLAVIDREFIYDNQGLLKGDHARLFVALAPLRRGDLLWIVNPKSAEPLLNLLWRLAAPAILAFGLAAAFAIWRHWPRFGPAVPVTPAARRSLAEQLRAHARFAARTGRLGALRRAQVRALEDVARRRIPAYAAESPGERAQALAVATGQSAAALAMALAERPLGGAGAEGAAILLLERARRSLLHDSPTRGQPA